jgi:hypothetical protein
VACLACTVDADKVHNREEEACCRAEKEVLAYAWGDWGSSLAADRQQAARIVFAAGSLEWSLSHGAAAQVAVDHDVAFEVA